MNNKQTSRILLTVAGSFFLLAILAPAASAAPTFSIKTAPADPPAIQPDIGSAPVTFQWEYNYNQQGLQAAGSVVPTATLNWNNPVECTKPGVIITGIFSQTFPLGQQSGTPSASTTVPGSSTFNVATTLQAPGEEAIECTFKGKVGAVNTQAGLGESSEGSHKMQVRSKYLGIVTAEVAGGTIQEAGPQKEIRYDIKLTNLGNSLTKVNFNLEGDTPEGWLPQPPIPTTIQSIQQGASSNQATVGFIISTPHKNGWNNADASFRLKILPESFKNPDSKGSELIIPVIARVRGIYVPGPEPALLVAAVLCSALVARAVRKD